MQTVLRTDAELAQLWRTLMGEGGFAARSLWLMLIDDDGRPAPLLIPVDDIPPQPDDDFGRGLASVVAELKTSGHLNSVAVLLSRPGDPTLTEGDRCWARHLVARGLAQHWPVHLATRAGIAVFAADDLLEPSTG